MSFGAEDIQAMNRRVARLDELYIRDGRDKKDHPWHGCYTGLALKYEREPGSAPD